LTPGQLLIVSRALKRAQSGRLLLHDFWFEPAPERGAMLLEQADVTDLSSQVQLALFYDGKLDLAALSEPV
jgi:hypothetical protein